MRHGNLYMESVGVIPIVVFDTETTGFDSDPYAEIVEFAAVRFEGGKVVGSYTARCDPGVPIGPGAERVHKIGDADVQGLPKLLDRFDDLMKSGLCEGAYPLAYNAPFDYSMLHRALPFECWRTTGWDVPLCDPQCVWLDPLVWGRRFGTRYRHKLIEACKRYDIALDQAHAAEADCTAAGQLFYAATVDFMGGPVRRLGDVVAEQTIYAHEQRVAFEKRYGRCL